MIQFQPKPAALRQPPKIIPCMRSLAERMAEDMREMAFAGENVNAESLKQRGYPEAAIKRLGEDAARIARRRSIRHVEA